MDLAAKKEAARARARAARAAGVDVPSGSLTLTEAAADYVRRQAAAADPVLIVQVTAGGCAGMEWHVDLGDAEQPCEEGWRESLQHGVRVRQDLRSALHLAGATLDFQGDLFQQGFQLRTPQGVARCSCGSSLGA